jgi:hypothetical protein
MPGKILLRVSVTTAGVRIRNWIYWHLEVVTAINYNTSKITVTVAHEVFNVC